MDQNVKICESDKDRRRLAIEKISVTIDQSFGEKSFQLFFWLGGGLSAPQKKLNEFGRFVERKRCRQFG